MADTQLLALIGHLHILLSTAIAVALLLHFPAPTLRATNAQNPATWLQLVNCSEHLRRELHSWGMMLCVAHCVYVV